MQLTNIVCNALYCCFFEHLGLEKRKPHWTALMCLYALPIIQVLKFQCPGITKERQKEINSSYYSSKMGTKLWTVYIHSP